MSRRMRVLGRVIVAIGLGCAGHGVRAHAQEQRGPVIPAETRQLIEQIYKAHLAERRYSDPTIELARTVRAVRLGLRELAAGAPNRGEAEEMRQLSLAVEKARSLADSMRAEADAEEEAAHLALIESRVEELALRVEEVVRAAPGDRGLRAGVLVDELEASLPSEEQRNPGPRRSPTFRTLPSATVADRRE